MVGQNLLPLRVVAPEALERRTPRLGRDPKCAYSFPCKVIMLPIAPLPAGGIVRAKFEHAFGRTSTSAHRVALHQGCSSSSGDRLVNWDSPKASVFRVAQISGLNLQNLRIRKFANFA